MSEHDRAMLANFTSRTFRDVADQDYIAARVLYRLDLYIPCIWESSQCVEKYLKAILLYNDVPVKGIKHDLTLLLERLELVSDIGFDFPADVLDFIRYLSGEAQNRYFSFPYEIKWAFLYNLDCTVWNLRRYCDNLRISLETGRGKKDLFPDNLRYVKREGWEKRPNKFRLFRGYLESIIDKKQSPVRDALVWKNPFYGRYRKIKLRNYQVKVSVGLPPHYTDPHRLALFERFVQFPKEVVVFIKSNLDKSAEK